MEMKSTWKPMHIPALDGLRGVAILMVMAFHFFKENHFINTLPLQTLQNLTVFGVTGVDLFFVLSGFLITRILLNSQASNFYFRNFYARRALRIFPLYYGFLFFTYFVLPRVLRTPPHVFQETIWYWFYLQNVALTFPGLSAYGPEHFWSLAVEEHFYLFWPFFVSFLNVRKLFHFSILLVFVAFFVRLLFMGLDLSVIDLFHKSGGIKPPAGGHCVPGVLRTQEPQSRRVDSAQKRRKRGCVQRTPGTQCPPAGGFIPPDLCRNRLMKEVYLASLCAEWTHSQWALHWLYGNRLAAQ